VLIWEHQQRARSRSRWLLWFFAILVVMVVVVVNAALALAMLAWPFNWLGGFSLPRSFVTTNTSVVLLFVLGGWWLESSQLGRGGLDLAQRIGAKPVFESEREFVQQQLLNIVQEQSLAANMPPPAVCVLPRVQEINAFAAGWQPDDWVVVVTDGALQALTREELEGLVAHELSHLREGDTLLNMRLAGMVGGLDMLYNFGRSAAEPDEHSGQRSPWAIFGWAVMACGWVGHLAGQLLKSAVSREREYLADARAVQWTRNKEGLGRTLRKVLYLQRQELRMMPTHTLVQHMLLIDNYEWQGRFADWLASHPSLEDRIERIYGEPMDEVFAQIPR
jgi:heat shock protein HtpX